MRPLVIEVFSPALVALLLLTGVARSGLLRVRLERSVHPLVRSIVGGVPRPRVFDLDPQLQPPHVELAQPVRSRRTKGLPVVASQHPWQSVASEHLAHLLPDGFKRRRLHHLAAQHVPARQIRDRQRVALLSVLCVEAPFEVHRPYVITSYRRSPFPYWHLRSAPSPSPAAAEPKLSEHPSDRAQRRHSIASTPSF